MIKLGMSDIVTAFNEKTIGSKVTDPKRFIEFVEDMIEKVDFESCRQPGQAYIMLPNRAIDFVSAGVGRHTNDPNDYVLRCHRNKVGSYLKRGRAVPVTSVAVVIYTIEAYANDPDVDKEEMKNLNGCTHVLVAVLASAGDSNSTLTPHRFISNLAGGNKEALLWTGDEIREQAREIAGYSNEWGVVAD
jgi:hypothetical protein